MCRASDGVESLALGRVGAVVAAGELVAAAAERLVEDAADRLAVAIDQMPVVGADAAGNDVPVVGDFDHVGLGGAHDAEFAEPLVGTACRQVERADALGAGAGAGARGGAAGGRVAGFHSEFPFEVVCK